MINRRICPREAFRIDLIEFLKVTMNNDCSIVLCAAINEIVHNGKLQKRLNSIGLVETSHLFSTETPLASYILGSKQINSI